MSPSNPFSAWSDLVEYSTGLMSLWTSPFAPLLRSDIDPLAKGRMIEAMARIPLDVASSLKQDKD